MQYRFIGVVGIFLSSAVMADTTLGDVAQNLLGPTSIVTKVMMLACYLVGAILVFLALAQYKIHRQSPKLVPLATPITMLVLGVVALLIPYVTKQFETGKAPVQSESRKSDLLPLPNLSNTRGPVLPAPGSQVSPDSAPPRSAPASTAPEAPPQTSPEAAPEPRSSEGQGGHWTDRYR